MEDMRSEIRAAFEREQAAHPPAPSLRWDVASAVAAHERPARSLQWIAVAAALILGLLVVVGLMSSRLIHVPVPAGKPPASPPVVTTPAASLPVMAPPVGATMIPLTYGHGSESFGAFNATGQSLFLDFACSNLAGSPMVLTLAKAGSGEFVASASIPCVGNPDFTQDQLAGIKGRLVLTIDASADTEWEVYVASGPDTGYP